MGTPVQIDSSFLYACRSCCCSCGAPDHACCCGCPAVTVPAGAAALEAACARVGPLSPLPPSPCGDFVDPPPGVGRRAAGWGGNAVAGESVESESRALSTSSGLEIREGRAAGRGGARRAQVLRRCHRHAMWRAPPALQLSSTPEPPPLPDCLSRPEQQAVAGGGHEFDAVA